MKKDEVKGERLKAKGGDEPEGESIKPEKEVKGKRRRAKGGDEPKAESPKPEEEVKGAPDSNRGLKAKGGKHPVQNDLPEAAESLAEATDIMHSSISTDIEINKSEIEHPAFEIIEPLTTDNSLLTNMEVHHHPKVEKKDFKEYLLEGLMIFIAVMMGFFAESLREHINEQSRSQDYAVTLYSDLKLDTTDLHGYLIYFKNAKANTDTLMQLLSNSDPKNIPSGKLYYFGLFGGAHGTFTPHDATLLEMKSSGSLRFFGDKIINRKLALYDQLCQSVKLDQEEETGIYVETREARARIFEYKYNEEANDLYHLWSPGFSAGSGAFPLAKRAAAWAKIDSFKKTNPPVLSYDKTLFNEYVELVRSRFLSIKVSKADSLLTHSTELLALLKKKYNLEDE